MRCQEILTPDADRHGYTQTHALTQGQLDKGRHKTCSNSRMACVQVDTPYHKHKMVGQRTHTYRQTRAHTHTGRPAGTGAHRNVILSRLKWWELDLR